MSGASLVAYIIGEGLADAAGATSEKTFIAKTVVTDDEE